jgi:ketosteroid isomerase-like protein
VSDKRQTIRQEAIKMQQKDTADPQISRQVNAVIKKYAEAVNNNDATVLAALCTEDAVVVTDGGIIYGPQAIENGIQTRSSDIRRILATRRISILLT